MKDVFKRAALPGRFDWWGEFSKGFRVALRRKARRALKRLLRVRPTGSNS